MIKAEKRGDFDRGTMISASRGQGEKLWMSLLFANVFYQHFDHRTVLIEKAMQIIQQTHLKILLEMIFYAEMEWA